MTAHRLRSDDNPKVANARITPLVETRRSATVFFLGGSGRPTPSEECPLPSGFAPKKNVRCWSIIFSPVFLFVCNVKKHQEIFFPSQFRPRCRFETVGRAGLLTSSRSGREKSRIGSLGCPEPPCSGLGSRRDWDGRLATFPIRDSTRPKPPPSQHRFSIRSDRIRSNTVEVEREGDVGYLRSWYFPADGTLV